MTTCLASTTHIPVEKQTNVTPERYTRHDPCPQDARHPLVREHTRPVDAGDALA